MNSLFQNGRDISSMFERATRRGLLCFTLTTGALGGLSSALAADQWQQWRGAQAQGVAVGSDYPVAWELPADAAWNVELDGIGGSSPIVTDGKVFVTMGQGGKNLLLAIDWNTGKELWRAELGDDTGGKHRKGSGSNPSPITDGTHIYAYYRSGDLACVDLAGKVVWQRNLQKEFGEDTLWWDLGSSPTLTENALVLAVMQSPPSPSYLAAFDKATGEISWKVDRELNAPEEAAQSYTSPVVAKVGDQEVIAVMGADHLTLHAVTTGEQLASLGGFNPDQEKYFRSISSPVVSGNIIVCPYSRGNTLTAVEMSKLLSGAGDDAILWHHTELGADVPTPAARDGRVYLCRDAGPLVALDAVSGETIWEVELPRNRLNYSSSPLVTDSHVYLTREDGHVMVVALPQADAGAKLVQENSLGDETPFTVASPAGVDGALLFRTQSQLIKIDAK